LRAPTFRTLGVRPESLKFVNYTEEPLINSGIADLRDEIFQVKARVAANSGTICQIRNADLDDFGRKAAWL